MKEVGPTFYAGAAYLNNWTVKGLSKQDWTAA
jgi:hypothetical protein